MIKPNDTPCAVSTASGVSLSLRSPLQMHGASVGVLTLRRPRVRDIEAIDRVSGETAKSIALIANLAEWTPDQVRELDAADFAAASKAVGEMLGGNGP